MWHLLFFIMLLNTRSIFSQTNITSQSIPCYTQQLLHTQHLLSHLITKHYFFHKKDIQEMNEYIVYNTIPFYHYKIVACISKLNKTQSLKPLLMLLKETEHHHSLQNKRFIKELLMLIIVTYKDIIVDVTHIKDINITKSALETITTISNKLDQLPIIELLNTIDMLTRELPKFLEKYEFYSKITWKEWFKKYWWVPPIIIGWFGLKVLVEFQHRPYHYFPLSYYKPHTHIQAHNDNEFIDTLLSQDQSKIYDSSITK